MKIYCARPISGCSFDEVHTYYTGLRTTLTGLGHEALIPLIAEEALIGTKSFKTSGFDSPITNDKSLVRRDHWLVTQADVVYTNLLGSKRISIGCVAELAWAHHLKRHTIVVMEDGNCHEHSFVHQMADLLFKDHQSALDYLMKIHGGM